MHSQHLPIFSLKRTAANADNNGINRVTNMAMANNISTLKSSPSNGLVSLFEAAKTRFARHRLYRQTVNELSALSNRELADLGLRRSMIRSLALQAVEDHTAR